MFPKELREKYHIGTVEEYKEMLGDLEGEIMYYQTFLIQTDHIPNKILEAQALDEEVDNYTEVLKYRKFARQEINRIKLLAP